MAHRTHLLASYINEDMIKEQMNILEAVHRAQHVERCAGLLCPLRAHTLRDFLGAL
jgi:hypothetical protein